MGHTVLIVDDDASFRGLAARILRSWKHEVVGEAGSVAEALAAAADLRPELILADIGLPDGTGFELTRRLDPASFSARVILISSDSDAANAAAAARVGASGFIPKDELSDKRSRALIDGD